MSGVITFITSTRGKKWKRGGNTPPPPPPEPGATLTLGNPTTTTSINQVAITCTVLSNKVSTGSLIVYYRASFSSTSFVNGQVTLLAGATSVNFTFNANRLTDQDREVTLSILPSTESIYILGSPISHKVTVPKQVVEPPVDPVSTRTLAYSWPIIQSAKVKADAGNTDYTSARSSLRGRVPFNRTPFTLSPIPAQVPWSYKNGSKWSPVLNSNGSQHTKPWVYHESMTTEEKRRMVMNYGGYWGPDYGANAGNHEYMRANTGVPFINIDGVSNNIMWSAFNHEEDLAQVIEDIRYCGLGYYFLSGTDKTNSLNKIVALTNTFFTDPVNGMHPSLYFSQGIPGQSDGYGRGTGYVALEELATAMDGWRLVWDVYPDADKTKLLAWLREFWEWSTKRYSPVPPRTGTLLENRQYHHHRIVGEVLQESGSANIHILTDCNMCQMAHFLGEAEWVKNRLNRTVPSKLSSGFTMSTSTSTNKSGRVGAQLTELRRTRPWTYSIKAIQGWIRLANIGEAVGVDVWNMKGTSGVTLRDGLRWMAYYAANPTAFHALYPITSTNPDITSSSVIDDVNMTLRFAKYKFPNDAELQGWCNTYFNMLGSVPKDWRLLYTPY